MEDRKIIVVNNNNNQNFDELKQYGELFFITDGFVNLDDIPTVLYNLKNKLREINKQDYIVPTGIISLNMLVAHYVLDKYGSITLLTFHKKTQSYQRQTIDSKQITGV
jgi:hypothetical protein